MIKINKTCLLLMAIFSFNNLTAQDPISLNIYFFSYDEKPTDKNTAPYIVAVFKKSTTDILWQREMYYNKKSQHLASKGLSKDSTGIIREGEFTYLYESGKNWKTGKYNNSKKEGEWKTYNRKGVLTRAINHSLIIPTPVKKKDDKKTIAKPPVKK